MKLTKGINNMNGAMDAIANNIDPNQQKPSEKFHVPKHYKAWKLLQDPLLIRDKGKLKIYRYDGRVLNDPTYPPIHLRDPRSHLTKIWTRSEILELPVPKFKIDANYVGIPPPVEVTITNLNDNVDKGFLTDLVTKYGSVEELHIYYHPMTKKHLGLARVVFETIQGANSCVENLNEKSVMGKKLDVFLDQFGDECRKIFESKSELKKVTPLVDGDHEGEKGTSSKYSTSSTPEKDGIKLIENSEIKTENETSDSRSCRNCLSTPVSVLSDKSYTYSEKSYLSVDRSSFASDFGYHSASSRVTPVLDFPQQFPPPIHVPPPSLSHLPPPHPLRIADGYSYTINQYHSFPPPPPPHAPWPPPGWDRVPPPQPPSLAGTPVLWDANCPPPMATCKVFPDSCVNYEKQISVYPSASHSREGSSSEDSDSDSQNKMSLDKRIELLLKGKSEGGLSSLVNLGLSDSGSEELPAEHPVSELSEEDISSSSSHHGPPSSSFCSEVLDSVPAEQDSEPLSHPPSPFLNHELYLKWHQFTKDRILQLKEQDQHETEMILANVESALKNIQTCKSIEDSMRREIGRKIQKQKRRRWHFEDLKHEAYAESSSSEQTNSEKASCVSEDDCMSLSSLSSGEEKILTSSPPQTGMPLDQTSNGCTGYAGYAHLPVPSGLPSPFHPVNYFRPPPYMLPPPSGVYGWYYSPVLSGRPMYPFYSNISNQFPVYSQHAYPPFPVAVPRYPPPHSYPDSVDDESKCDTVK